MKKHHYKKEETRKLIFDKYQGKCAYCGETLEDKFTVDHIDPLKRHIKGSKSHLNVLENYNPCCQECNSSKGSCTLDEWRLKLKSKYEWLLKDSSGFRTIVRMGLVKPVKSPVIFYFERIAQ